MFTLNEALQALQGHDEFAIKRYDGLVCLDYIVCLPGTFDYTHDEVKKRAYALWEAAGSPQGGEQAPGHIQPVIDSHQFWYQAEQVCHREAWIRQNCRGVTFDEQTGNIVSLPLHKFFNIGQTADTQFGKLRHCQARIYEKADGSMIHFFMHPQRNELQAATCRSTQTSQAQESLVLALKNQLVLSRICATIAEGWTPIFEFVAPHNQIVVRYSHPRLVYLISRNRQTGEYRFDQGFPDVAKTYDFPFAEIFDHLKDDEEFEGYVCHLDNGMIVKAKTPWYTERHRAVDLFMRPAYKLYEVVYNGVMDDVLAIAPERFKSKLASIYEEAQRDLLQEKVRVEGLFDNCLDAVAGNRYSVSLPQLRKDNKSLRKKFVFYVQNHHKEDFSLLMSHYVGNDPTDKIKERLLENYKVKYPGRFFLDLEEVS